jgi:hypothetical protein
MLTLALDFCDEESAHGDSIFQQIHSPDFFWSEAFAMYSAIMELGVKKIYYKEDPNEEKPMPAKINNSISKVESNREKKRRLLAQQRMEASKTNLKKRSNRIFH